MCTCIAPFYGFTVMSTTVNQQTTHANNNGSSRFTPAKGTHLLLKFT